MTREEISKTKALLLARDNFQEWGAERDFEFFQDDEATFLDHKSNLRGYVFLTVTSAEDYGANFVNLNREFKQERKVIEFSFYKGEREIAGYAWEVQGGRNDVS